MWYSAGMKKRLNLIMLLMCGMLVFAPLACALDENLAEERPVAKKTTKPAKKAMAEVPELLSKATYLTRKKPNLKAKYYGFLRSASWCVPCQIFVPQLLEGYSKMKGANLEVILLGQEDEAVVKKYMKEHKYNIPGVMPSELGSVPGLSFEGLGFPSMCIVDADGNFVALSGGKNMQEWKKQIKEYEAEQRKAKKKAKDSEPEEDSAED